MLKMNQDSNTYTKWIVELQVQYDRNSVYLKHLNELFFVIFGYFFVKRLVVPEVGINELGKHNTPSTCNHLIFNLNIYII